MRLYIVVLLLCCGFISCQKDLNQDIGTPEQIPIQIQFSPIVSGDSLEFGEEYFNGHGEPYTVSDFRFYLHAVELENTVTGTITPFDDDTYHLINFADQNTAILRGDAIRTSYNQLNFILGVDSIFNVSGAQDGALDPAKGMFWTWNSGYIMARLEGNTPLAATPNNAFEFHIGGFSGVNNVVRKISLPLNGGSSVNFSNYPTPLVKIDADVNKWFVGKHDMLLGVNPVCMTPGELAKKFADNYYNMFSVSSVTNTE